MLKASHRKKYKADSFYEKLLEYKDKHKGSRCFIIATGPSLTYEDLSLLKGEYTFSMNSICLSYSKTDFRPTYYGIQDPNVFEKLYPVLFEEYKDSPLFYSVGLEKGKAIPSEWIPMPVNGLYHMYDYLFTDKRFVKFSNNSYYVIYDGYTITYSLIQLAVYMGFSTIYLLGCDCNYSDDKNKQHFIETGVFDPSYKTAHDRMIIAYKEAQNYAEKNGIKIINVTRGGMLDVFPRMKLEDVINGD